MLSSIVNIVKLAKTQTCHVSKDSDHVLTTYYAMYWISKILDMDGKTQVIENIILTPISTMQFGYYS